ncbi:hypothetical protein CEXT_231391 [Caerostris extrusa]|uniref:Uncharacterized protein n=1 Tax=Caerostris extrusa TaxID=172846 RepID=A0AAV4WKQ3_CAEEX|nr:hypothetical protein CEXT_231391 [Caerostris extrusa]
MGRYKSWPRQNPILFPGSLSSAAVIECEIVHWAGRGQKGRKLPKNDTYLNSSLIGVHPLCGRSVGSEKQFSSRRPRKGLQTASLLSP